MARVVVDVEVAGAVAAGLVGILRFLSLLPAPKIDLSFRIARSWPVPGDGKDGKDASLALELDILGCCGGNVITVNLMMVVRYKEWLRDLIVAGAYYAGNFQPTRLNRQNIGKSVFVGPALTVV
jgi:hypothetical protein